MVPYLQISCIDLTTWQGSRVTAQTLTAHCHDPLWTILFMISNYQGVIITYPSSKLLPSPQMLHINSAYLRFRWRSRGSLFSSKASLNKRYTSLEPPSSPGRKENNSFTPDHIVMNSLHGNVSHITGPLWGESTGDQWIPLTKGQ